MRALSAALLIALATPVAAATYTLRGDGTCMDRACTAETTFTLDSAFYGQTNAPLLDTAYVVARFDDGAEAAFGSFLWQDDPFATGEDCTDICAYITTDIDGALIDLFAELYSPREQRYNLAGWYISDQAFGTWDIVDMSLPVPASLPLLLSALGAAAFLRRSGRH